MEKNYELRVHESVDDRGLSLVIYLEKQNPWGKELVMVCYLGLT